MVSPKFHLFARWFALSGAIKTPTVQLKQLKILSRIHKDYADSSQFLFDEKSPILDSTGGSSESPESVEPSGMINDVKVLTPSSVVYGTIDPQVLKSETKAGQTSGLWS